MGKKKHGDDPTKPVDIASSDPGICGSASQRTSGLPLHTWTVYGLHGIGKHLLEKRSHWSLLIFCHFGESLRSKTRTPCMLLLDSLQMANPRRLEPDIRKFVFDIYRAEGRPEKKQMIYRIPLLVPKVPQQRDGKECGYFVLYFISLFVEGAPENFSVEGYPYFMRKDWFIAEGVDRFCERLDSFGM
ncbi:hypothetical protein CRYUN_Cryun12cG0170200 [Craigia yunnanensis]